MRELKVGNESKSYMVYMENNMDRLSKVLKEHKITEHTKLFLITDDIVYKLYSEKIKNISSKMNIKIYYFKHGEENKNINTVQRIYDFLIGNNADRESVLIALGGGMVGDVVGFVSSTYMRGMRYINIPTTLLSQVDSCIGGKTGINYSKLKNIMGSFYEPEFVYISINFLKTLEEKQILNGVGEIIKYGLIEDSRLLEFLNENAKQILNLEHDKILHIILECLKIKNKIVNVDKKDLEARNVLNFGHTIGHSIEVNSNYIINHGIAVALGILTSIKISELKCGLDSNIYVKLENLYKKLGLPIYYEVDNYDLFLYAINHDKKNVNGIIKMALISDIGDYKVKVSVKSEDIVSALKLSISREE